MKSLLRVLPWKREIFSPDLGDFLPAQGSSVHLSKRFNFGAGGTVTFPFLREEVAISGNWTLLVSSLGVNGVLEHLLGSIITSWSPPRIVLWPRSRLVWYYRSVGQGALWFCGASTKCTQLVLGETIRSCCFLNLYGFWTVLWQSSPEGWGDIMASGLYILGYRWCRHILWLEFKASLVLGNYTRVSSLLGVGLVHWLKHCGIWTAPSHSGHLHIRNVYIRWRQFISRKVRRAWMGNQCRGTLLSQGSSISMMAIRPQTIDWVVPLLDGLLEEKS